MAYISAGTFVMGDAEISGARPTHTVTLSTYCIDLTEVTVAAYRRCNATGCTTPNTGSFNNWGVAGRDNHPINGVDWSQSRAYCQWRGGDLPTESQWEYAARGSDAVNRIYPWGMSNPASQLCWNRDPSPGYTCPVQSYPEGSSPFGLFDMAGNVWEWTIDYYDLYDSAAAVDPTGPALGTNRVCRGGSWSSTSTSVVRAAYRGGGMPLVRYDNVGFRCASRAM
jgi:formylglycine-generating enzyme required for sulfatase activity